MFFPFFLFLFLVVFDSSSKNLSYGSMLETNNQERQEDQENKKQAKKERKEEGKQRKGKKRKKR